TRKIPMAGTQINNNDIFAGLFCLIHLCVQKCIKRDKSWEKALHMNIKIKKTSRKRMFPASFSRSNSPIYSSLRLLHSDLLSLLRGGSCRFSCGDKAVCRN